jgi:hypothetical protein
MLSFIHPKLQIREFPIQFVIKSKKGLLLVKKEGHQLEGKTSCLSKRCEKIWYMKFRHLLCFQETTMPKLLVYIILLHITQRKVFKMEMVDTDNSL